jgi:hypothetical protein
MMTDRRARWTANGAFAAAVLALGLSTWAVGCREPSVDNARELAPPTLAAAPAAPAAKAPAAAPAVTPVSVTKAPPGPARPNKTTAAPDALSVRRLRVTNAIENREPAAVTELSASEGAIFAFVELANAAPEEQLVVVTFEREGSSVGHIKLRVPGASKRWRTWGQTRRIREAGEWHAVVRSEDGRELSRTSFVVVK